MRPLSFRRDREAVNAGARSWPVVIEQRGADDTDESGFPVEDWTTLVEPEWMSRRDMTGQERFAANQMTAGLDTIWSMGYRQDMDPDLVDVPKARRLVYLGRIYDITGAAIVGDHEGIELATLAKVG